MKNITNEIPMITVPPPTPITAADRVARALAKIEHAIDITRTNPDLHYPPLRSALDEARMEAQSALQKHIDEIQTARALGAQFGV